MMKEGTPIDLFRGQTTISMQRTTRLLFGTAGALKSARISESFYWIPSVMKLSGVDGVLGDTGDTTQNNVFCLQATIAGDHRDPNDGINKVWLSADSRVRRRWHFVLVCEDHLQARLLVDDFARRLRGFTLGQRRVNVQVWACVLPVR
ncbi:hypothetical protein CPB85DRAFT_1291251 [Mucidula mucida]|nr:hypothetical protein CPB85DRAFT_1291251 [Mucidula mucida]